MKHELEARTTVWLHAAYQVSENYKHEEILPLHLYYAILSDDEFCADFWQAYPRLQQEYLEAVIVSLQKIDPTLDCDENPGLSDELAKIIAFAHAMRHPAEAPLSREALFKVLLTEKPFFAAKPHKLLQNMASEKITSLSDDKGYIVSLKSTFDSSFFLNYKPLSLTLDPIVNLPFKGLPDEVAGKVVSLKDALKKVIFGQGHALDTVEETLVISAAGFERENKTAGTFLFRGPTGSGKTELAREIAFELDIPLLKFDMSEFKEGHSIAKFIGSPPGYVGNGEGGRLVKQVNANPVAVVLLDEIEKAHRNIDDLLLQVMADGVLTDGRGIKADFSNIVLIMTSNVGAREMAQNGLGFGAVSQQGQESADEILRTMFSPEFRNRLDADIVFNDVKNTVMPQIVAKFVEEFQMELEQKNLTGEFTAAAMDRLVSKGRLSEFGARDAKRIIEKNLKARVAMSYLKGDLPDGTHVHVDVNAGEGFAVTFSQSQTDIPLPPFIAEGPRLNS